MNNNKVAAVAAYITWIGFLIAILMGDKGDGYVSHHMNQALVINILSICGAVIGIVPILGSTVAWVVSLAVSVFGIWGIYRAIIGSTEPLPIVGDFHIIG